MSTKKKAPSPLVIYHGPHCMDGFTSAWVACTALNDPDTTLYPMNYGEKADMELLEFLRTPDLTYSYIYIVDFSLKLDILAEVCTLVGSTLITILDHHKSAFAIYFPDKPFTATSHEFCVLNDNQVAVELNNMLSGAGITWDHFYPNTPVPPLVSYVQDRDLWQFLYPETQAIHKYLSSLPKTIATWGDTHAKLCHRDGKVEVIAKGRALLDIYESQVASIVLAAEPCVIKGQRGLMVECDGSFASDVGNALAHTSGTFGMTYYETLDEEYLAVSLRSNGEYDVEALARKFGGGGHRNAAGFRLSIEEVMEVAGINLN